MKKTVRTIAIYIFAAVLAVFCLFTVSAQSFLSARADSRAAELTGLLDKTSIENDLKELDLSSLSTSDGLQLVYFGEVGYREANSSDYGIYFYIYNPEETAFITTADNNTVNMAVSFDSEGEPNEYANLSLTFIDRTDDHRFYKFRLTDSESMYEYANSYFQQRGSRRYDIAGIQLLPYGEKLPHDYATPATYTYTGYAKGYGEDVFAESTLECTMTEREVIQFEDVQHTYYHYPQTAYEFSEIKTVYFSIPNDVLDYYGAIYSIQAEYYEYNLQPVLVIEDSAAYEALKDYVGVDISDGQTTPYKVYSLGTYYPAGFEPYYESDWVYGNGVTLTFIGTKVQPTEDAEYSKKIVFLFGCEDASDFTVTREMLIEYMDDYTATHGSGNAYGGYNNDLFYSDSAGFDGATYIDIAGDELFDLEGFDTGSVLANWFASIIGGYDNEDIKDISPIYPVKSSDLELSDVSGSLYVAPQDEAEFIAYCRQQMAQDKTVYMFRYKVDPYADHDTYTVPTGLSGFWQTSIENSIRFSTINLGFDIISLGFQTDKGLTIVPVVSDPINVIPDLEPGGDILDDTNGVPWLTIALLLAVSIGGMVVTRIIKNEIRKAQGGKV